MAMQITTTEISGEWKNMLLKSMYQLVGDLSKLVIIIIYVTGTQGELQYVFDAEIIIFLEAFSYIQRIIFSCSYPNFRKRNNLGNINAINIVFQSKLV